MNTDNTQQDMQQNAATDSAKTMATIVYALQAASFFLGFSIFVAIVVNYVKKSEVQGTWLESHFRWQIRTFWFGLLWAVVGLVMLFFYIGVVILLANAVWFIYRIVKGWLRLNDNKEMYS